MKKIVFAALFLTAIIAMSACTNKEGDADLDVITPNDSTQSGIEMNQFPEG
ncbi:MAG TPA: hypothetical protein VKN36_16730 [Eudoraea sp.]|nr:hypothetical protein [Eudoraea sp.]